MQNNLLRPAMRQSVARKCRAGASVAGGLALAIVCAFHPGTAIAGVQAASAGSRAIGQPIPASPDGLAVAPRPGMVDSARPSVSSEVAYVAGWIGDTGDNSGMPYIIIDKVNATVYVFDPQGRFQGAAPALLGMEHGDGSAKGLGNRKMSAIQPTQRTTPAGRYVASLGRDVHGGDILWIDYANAIALHRVVKGTPVEHRAQRLESETSQDNRISYGCINVPVKFYESVVSNAFANTSGVVYILPEMSSARDMFKSPGEAAAPAQSPAQPANHAKGNL
ncbi:MAG: L,D-transpeptidase [Xanthomonadaceae bacterium]|nr:L,D-transpeptidase [Xanthomonadaceae bacterium]